MDALTQARHMRALAENPPKPPEGGGIGKSAGALRASRPQSYSDSLPGEEWRPIADHPDYLVSSLGRLLSFRRSKAGIVSQPAPAYGGYVAAQLRRPDGGTSFTRMHVLVAEAFLGPRAEGQQVRHLNGDPADNRVENLAWGSAAENAEDRRRHGTHNNTQKTHCKNGHALEGENCVRQPGRRRCRTCDSAAKRRYKQRIRQERAVAR